MASSVEGEQVVDHFEMDRLYNYVFNHLVAMIEHSINANDRRQYGIIYCEKINENHVWTLRNTPTGEELNAPGFQEVMTLMFWAPNIHNAGSSLRQITTKILDYRKQQAGASKSEVPTPPSEPETLNDGEQTSTDYIK